MSKGEELIKVPDVSGLTTSKAQNKLEKLGFKVSVKKAYSDSVDKDKVISQDVSAGKEVKKGTDIVIKVSKGEEPTEPPQNNIDTNVNVSDDSNTYVEPEEPKIEETQPEKNEDTDDSEDSLDDWELIN